MLRGPSVVLVAILLASGSAHARELKIAAWNIEHLAEQTGAGRNTRTDADYDVARKYAEQLNADVIAFQEVENLIN